MRLGPHPERQLRNKSEPEDILAAEDGGVGRRYGGTSGLRPPPPQGIIESDEGVVQICDQPHAVVHSSNH